jgi:hypothetical protein
MSGKSRLQRAKGGRTGLVASGNPDVIKEAEGDERKRGGKVKRKAGGKVIGLMTGGGVKPRLDRPGRKRGGAVGADRSPLSSAHMHAKPGTAPSEEENGAPD